MIKINLSEFETTKKWLKLRRTGIGGSDCSIVLGVNRYKTPLELWLDKTDQIEVSEEETEVTYWGKTLESVIRDEFEKRTKLKVTKPEFTYRSEEYPFMIADLDGEIDDPIYGTCVFEAKTVSAFKKDEWNGKIPSEYLLQCQHYLAVSNYQGAYIAALIGGNEFVYDFIPRDEATIKMIIEEEAKFWKCVKEMIPPEIDGSNAAKKYVEGLYPKAKDELETIDISEEATVILENYDDIVEQEGQLKILRQEIENKIKMLMKDHQIAKAGARTITWKNVTSKRLDSKLLQMSEPEIYDKYLTQSESRRFCVK